MTSDVLAGERVVLRPYALDDVADVRREADDVLVARWMTHAFPSPYTLRDAQEWVALARAASPPNHFAIDIDGAFAGGIGLTPLAGERAGCALFGYWLGRRFWGRGIATEAARLLAEHALTVRRLRRLEASVFAPNGASMRVLERAGFQREAVHRLAYVERDGTPVDAVLYVRLQDTVSARV